MIFQWWHILVILLPILPSLYSIWHIWRHDFNNEFQKKTLWLVISVFLPVIGGIAYLIAGKKYAGALIERKNI